MSIVAVAGFPFAQWQRARVEAAVASTGLHATVGEGELELWVADSGQWVARAVIDLVSGPMGARCVLDDARMEGDPDALGEALDRLVDALGGDWEDPLAPPRRFLGWPGLLAFYEDFYEEVDLALRVRVEVGEAVYVVQLLPWPVLDGEDWVRFVCLVGDASSASARSLEHAAGSSAGVFQGGGDLGMAWTLPVDALDPWRVDALVRRVAEEADGLRRVSRA